MASNSAAPKPKRPLSAYMHFVKANRASVVKAHPAATFGQIGKKLGEMWRAMSKQEKAKYEAMAKSVR